MVEFAPILAAAIARIGDDALRERLPEVKDAAALTALSDDRYLSLLSLRVFRAGLKHSLVDTKWPGFEAAFRGFVPDLVRAMPDEEVEALMNDRRLIRHWGKLRSVRNNAAALAALSAEHGGFGRFLAAWPADRTVELWAELDKRFDQMGGESAPRFLRMAGRDTFIFTPSVTAALTRWGVAQAAPKGKGERLRLQGVFNNWADETGRKLAHLSMILACSVDD
jgi:3-methyladenine DNA glycosylase Tag